MSLQLQGKIIRFPLREYVKSIKKDISPRSISTLKLLWISLADFHNEKTGQCNPSIATLSRCIEKSSSQTTLYMGMLKDLGLVVVSRNAKGGRYTPQYELSMPSHPTDKVLSPPEADDPQNQSEYAPPIKSSQDSHEQDGSSIISRMRILIEPLDKSLIKSLVNEKNIYLKTDELRRLGEKYRFPFKQNTPIHEVETWLIRATK